MRRSLNALLALIMAVLWLPLPAVAESACSREYDRVTQFIETLAAYHQAVSESRNGLWKRATTLHAELLPSPPAGCDLLTFRRWTIGHDVYFALSVANDSISASKGNLDSSLTLLVDDTAASLPNYTPALRYTVEAGLDETFMRWLVQRLVELYQSNHYAMDDLRPGTLSGVKYWLPSFSLP